MGEERISRGSLEDALQKVVGSAHSEIVERVPILRAAVGLAVIGVIALAYSLGRRQGQLRSTVVEVRRL